MKTETTAARLANKVALVTGGSRGIGEAIAIRLAAEGASVAITYTSAKEKAEAVVKSIEASGGKAFAIKADSGDAAEVKNAVDETVRVLGGLDILVNNAGVALMAPLEEFKLEDFDRTFAVNVRGVFVASQEASRHMKEGGRIIIIGSTNADRMPFAGGGVYAMSKAAVAGLTKGLARDLGPRGITVTNVQPGPVNTDMNPETGPFAESLKKLMAIDRYGKGEEIAAFVAFLASAEAAYITGTSLTIDGGFGA
ncbi:3-oxoacyl-ACP reductase family protein [Verrucomicrobium sp. BvORR106]|uniref:3-oxoacyl-ACP reductase family protein n=1 Tax=Verrucomicrobium sp. BvORR106 TaxID=1403819 RepID=UPI00056DE0E5|nr:3-oxoacyl-ACP reductase family protein [Verrucomicrobium sp. BvORR106]